MAVQGRQEFVGHVGKDFFSGCFQFFDFLQKLLFSPFFLLGKEVEFPFDKSDGIEDVPHRVGCFDKARAGHACLFPVDVSQEFKDVVFVAGQHIWQAGISVCRFGKYSDLGSAILVFFYHLQGLRRGCSPGRTGKGIL